MPRVLSLKKIKGKKESAHPNSRKSHQIQRAALRQERLVHQDKVKERQQYKTINRFGFFKVVAETTQCDSFSDDDLRALIRTYINRTATEIETLIESRRPGRPKPSRLDALEQARDAELSEFKSGFKIPLMDTIESLKLLKNWRGDAGGLNNVPVKWLREA